jgi:hypothetical protein
VVSFAGIRYCLLNDDMNEKASLTVNYDDQSGEDLVEHMFRIAAGERLPDALLNKATDGCLPFQGWAIESRVYAEVSIRTVYIRELRVAYQSFIQILNLAYKH